MYILISMNIYNLYLIYYYLLYNFIFIYYLYIKTFVSAVNATVSFKAGALCSSSSNGIDHKCVRSPEFDFKMNHLLTLAHEKFG